MLHRVIYGSIERFIGVLIEHYAGSFPLWLAPVQVNIIPVNNEYHLEYANKIKEMLQKEGIRVNLDDRDEKLSYKMREAQIKKYPYNLILGQTEVDNHNISYRTHGSKETISISNEEFIKKIKEEIKTKGN